MSKYVFDQAWQGERERLANLERWLDPGTTKHMQTIGVAEGWRCLEIGGGGGSIAQWLCAQVGSNGRVVATDLDTRFLDVLEEPNLDVRRHDIVADDLAKDEYDLIHARLLLEHLPPRVEVIERLVGALKPGGWLLIEDLDTITHVPITPNEAYQRVTDGVFSIMTSVGFDPTFGRKLPMVLTEAGLDKVYAEGRVVIGAREANPGIEMWRLTMKQLREPVVAAGLASEQDIEEALRVLDDANFTVMPPCVVAAWGQKRPALS